MLTVVETGPFIRAAARVFTDDERNALIDYLSTHPFVGDEIPGGGGVRKMRFAIGNRGKSGGARVVYFVYSSEMPLVLLTCYGKNEKANLSDAEVNTLAKLATILKAEFRGTKR